MNQTKKFKVTWILISVVCALGYGWYNHQANVRSMPGFGSVTKHYENPDKPYMGEEVYRCVGRDGYGKVTVILFVHDSSVVFHQPDSDKSLAKSPPFFSRQFQSSFAITSGDKPELWIDDKQRELGGSLIVIYISDTIPATDIVVSASERLEFVKAARTMDPLLFIETWIYPRIEVAGIEEVGLRGNN